MEETGGKKRILLVDDHPIVRSGFAEVIGRTPDLEVVGEAGDAETALHWLEKNRPDLVVADISLPSMNGIEMTKLIKERYPKIPVLIVSMHEEALYAERALRAGAKGYVVKLEPPDTLLNAARDVLAGEVFISRRTAERALKSMVNGPPTASTYDAALSKLGCLTDRELEVFEAIGEGRTTREIAERLGRSIKTVETHRTNAISKLGLSGAAALRECAIRWIESGRSIKAMDATLKQIAGAASLPSSHPPP